ncbi:hypothetical protein LINGRAPRIM_LOCUS1342, partial [Linum grandiflorum]
ALTNQDLPHANRENGRTQRFVHAVRRSLLCGVSGGETQPESTIKVTGQESQGYNRGTLIQELNQRKQPTCNSNKHNSKSKSNRTIFPDRSNSRDPSDR